MSGLSHSPCLYQLPGNMYKFCALTTILPHMEFTEATEGKTTFFVPVQDTGTQFPPSSAAIFFNRRMEMNRDATILLLSILRPSDYIDAMGATGARGLRVANECGIPVTINDRDKAAIPLIEKNASLSGNAIEITNRDINALLSERSFDTVDLDPFGSPATCIDAAIRGCRRFLLVTATDTAPLCGAHMRAGIRRYFARPKNTEYHSEVGLRILLGFVVRETVKYDRGIEPLFCFAREHFVRLHLRITRGAKAGDDAISHIGHILQCPKCPYRTEQTGMVPQARTCPHCGEPLDPVGPLWLGPIMKPEIVDQMMALLPERELGTKKEFGKILLCCREELPIAGFYDYHQLAQILKCSPPNITTVLDRIQAAGYAVSRTHYCGTGIKTEAPLPVIFEAIRGQ